MRSSPGGINLGFIEPKTCLQEAMNALYRPPAARYHDNFISRAILMPSQQCHWKRNIFLVFDKSYQFIKNARALLFAN
jgi:hypothetical protein